MTGLLLDFGYFVHIGGGFAGLISGTVALLAAKGRRLHAVAGNVFFVSMLLMAVFAIVLAAVLPHQGSNLMAGLVALYLVGTGWLTVRRRPGAIGLAERIALVASVCLAAPFVVLTSQLMLGLPTFVVVPTHGPIVVALSCFTVVLVIAAVSDAKVVVAGGISGAPRIARHLWRMCLGLTMAAGSGFTNGLARLLPGPYHVPPAFFVPTFVPVVFLIFWMIRVRLTGWRGLDTAPAAAE